MLNLAIKTLRSSVARSSRLHSKTVFAACNQR